MRAWHWVVSMFAFAAGMRYAAEGDYGTSMWPLLVCVWVYIAAGESVNADRYRFIKKYVRVDMKNIETGEVTKAGGESLDAIVDQHLNQ